jgi:hypothetical protein
MVRRLMATRVVTGNPRSRAVTETAVAVVVMVLPDLTQQ